MAGIVLNISVARCGFFHQDWTDGVAGQETVPITLTGNNRECCGQAKKTTLRYLNGIKT